MKVTIFIDDRVYSDTEIADALMQSEASGKTTFEKATLVAALCTGSIEQCLQLLASDPKTVAGLPTRAPPTRGA